LYAWDMRNAHKILVGKPEGKKPRGIDRRMYSMFKKRCNLGKKLVLKELLKVVVILLLTYMYVTNHITVRESQFLSMWHLMIGLFGKVTCSFV